jgi:hypothetical protein
MISKKWTTLLMLPALLFHAASFAAETKADVSDACSTWAMSLIPEKDRPAPDQLDNYLYNFQQANPLASDPLGDYVLLMLNDQTFVRIYDALIYKDANHGLAANDVRREIYDVNAPLVEATVSNEPTAAQIHAMDIPDSDKQKMLVDLANSQLQIEGRVNPIRSRQMIDALTEVIREESNNGFPPKTTPARQWSPEIKAHCGKKFSAMLKLSKILETMARGDSSRFLITGQEKALEDYLMSQTENSVEPTDLFRASYRLNTGDVEEALLTIENVLSRNWRNPHREDLVLTHRLAPMANFYENRGTNFGVWYHFFGVVYYGYVYGAADAFVTGAIEHVGSLTLGGFAPQMQKGAVNTTGGFVGAGVHKKVTSGLAMFGPLHPEFLQTSYYLNLTEDYRDRIEVYSNPDFKLVLGNQKIEITSNKVDLRDCRLELVTDEGNGFAEGREIVWEEMNFKMGEATSVLMPVPGLQGVRAFIDGCAK